jgi:hypothetical protein
LSEVVAVGKSGRYICIDLVPRKVVDARSKRRSGRVFSAVLGGPERRVPSSVLPCNRS